MRWHTQTKGGNIKVFEILDTLALKLVVYFVLAIYAWVTQIHLGIKKIGEKKLTFIHSNELAFYATVTDNAEASSNQANSFCYKLCKQAWKSFSELWSRMKTI